MFVLPFLLPSWDMFARAGTLQRLGVLIIKKLLMLIVVAWVWRDVFCFEEHTFAASAIIATSFYLHFNMFMDMMTAICAVLGFAVRHRQA